MPTTASIRAPSKRPELQSAPVLEPGDKLTRTEFERRYERMPHLKKAELIEGIVYMPSPVRIRNHGQPQLRLGRWLGAYEDQTAGVITADNATVRLDLDNEPQPDLLMIKTAEKGGKARISEDDYVEGAPELVVEIVGSSAAYDLHQKKGVYRRNGVREYLAWITTEQKISWWELRDEYQELAPDADGVLKSRVFPGLWLDTEALLRGDMQAVLATLQHGLGSPEHTEFCYKR